MAGEDRGTFPNVKNLDLKLSLLKEGSSFSFFQAVRLLRLFALNDNGREEAGYPSLAPLRVTPLLSLAFPPADIAKIEESSEGPYQYQIIANFFGLYGVSSPLPTFYTEDLISDVDDDGRATKDFFDILHQRLYALLCSSWLKYRQFQQVREEQNGEHITRLFCLLGLGEAAFRQKMGIADNLLRYLGIISQQPHSALGLKTLLHDYLQLPVDIEPCVPRKASIPSDQRLQLGGITASLGGDCYIGEEIDDQMGKFRITVGPLLEEEYRAFIPGSKKYNDLVQLTDFFILDPLEYDIDVIMAESQAKTVCLGGPRWANLGHDTWIFSGETLGKTTSRFHPRTQPPH